LDVKDQEGRMKVLYVDDQPDICELVSLSLELDPGLEVRTLQSGREALALMRGGVWRPDLLLLDVMMPDIDGPAVMRQLLIDPQLSGMKAIYVTARAMEHERRTLMGDGVIGVITKPFDPMKLAQDIRNLHAQA
jgi:two-component system, OmpR family, response regulator